MIKYLLNFYISSVSFTRLEALEKVEMNIFQKFTSFIAVNSSFEVYFDTAADSCESTKTRRQTKIKVGRYAVQCRVNVQLLTTVKRSCLPRGRSIFDNYCEGNCINMCYFYNALNLLGICTYQRLKDQKIKDENRRLQNYYSSTGTRKLLTDNRKTPSIQPLSVSCVKNRYMYIVKK